jgi:hypothetical protein
MITSGAVPALLPAWISVLHITLVPPPAAFARRPWGGCNLATVTGAAGWREMELGAPEIARLGMARLNAARIALLGTLRCDGSPRISPVEPYFAAGQLLVGAMAWSTKAADLRRDPRYVLHSTVTGPDSGEEELKLYGSAVEAGQDLRGKAAGAWWQTWPAEKATVFRLHIAQAVAIEWDTGHGLMTAHQWSPRAGYHKVSRTYP